MVDDGTDLESISEGLRLVSIDEGDAAEEKSDDELARMAQVRIRYLTSLAVADGIRNWTRFCWSMLVYKLIW